MKVRLEKRKRSAYSQETLRKALEEMKSGMSINIASRLYNIPKSTLHAKLINRNPTNRPGPDPVLSKQEEEDLVTWIHYMCSTGRSISRDHLIDSVALLVKKLKKPNLFTDGRPGRHWVEGFFRRHEGLKKKIRDNNLRVSKEKLTLENLKIWFTIIKANLKDENLQNVDSTRVFNIGEVIVPLNFDSKNTENVTILVTGNAAGKLAPTMTIFDSEKHGNSCTDSLQERFICTADKALMTSELFYEYIEHYFYPWLVQNKIQLPIILYVDEHVSYYTQMLNEFCYDHKIALIALPSNTSLFMQPMDVGLFPPLKKYLKTNFKKLTSISKPSSNRDYFGSLLQKALDSLNITEILVNSFRECRLHPLPSKEIDYKKLFEKYRPRRRRRDERSEESSNEMSPLESIEKYIDSSKLEAFRSAINASTWTGNIEDKNLFYVWKKILLDTCQIYKSNNIENCAIDMLEDGAVNDVRVVVVHPYDSLEDSDSDMI